MRPRLRTRREILSIVLTTASIAIGAVRAGGASGAAERFRSPPASPATELEKSSDLVVHEWGTFLGMNGSDGAALDGMYHEEHALPAFVHSRSRDQLRLPLVDIKGETPVIYFYTNNRQNVRVGVHFPQGIWTQWYPAARLVEPSLLENAATPDRLGRGRICWYAELIPPAQVIQKNRGDGGAAQALEFKLPPTSSDALWNHAREVDAAFVKTTNLAAEPATAELERFLFYRGLGRARMPLTLLEGGKGTLTLDREPTLGDGVRHVIAIRVENGRGAYRYIPALRQGQQISDVIPAMDKAQPLAEFTPAIARDLAARLTESGLYEKEARAMVNTWTSSYFETDGIRVLFVLPQSWTDAFIPIAIVPQPKQVVRVMVGRLELLTRERERLAEQAVHRLFGQDASRSQQAYAFLRDQGRYVEPIVRRVMRNTQDSRVRTLCQRLLLADFVTELCAAVHNAADGKRLSGDPLLLRAQMARLLREVGQDAEARSEGTAVLTALRTHPTELDQFQAASPAALAIRAAAVEATGDDHLASRIYARGVELQLRAGNGEIDPGMIPALRDWWVGRAFARCVLRSGQAVTTIAALQGNRSRPGGALGADRTSRVLIAFLLDGQGQEALADAEWSSLAGQPQLKSADAAPALSAKSGS